MRDFIVKVEADFKPARELVCDFCAEPLAYPFYAYVSKRKEGIYLKEYFCENCLRKYFRKRKVHNIQEVEENIRLAIYENLKRDYYGVIVEVKDLDEALFLINNPFLIDLWGEKF